MVTSIQMQTKLLLFQQLGPVNYHMVEDELPDLIFYKRHKVKNLCAELSKNTLNLTPLKSCASKHNLSIDHICQGISSTLDCEVTSSFPDVIESESSDDELPCFMPWVAKTKNSKT